MRKNKQKESTFGIQLKRIRELRDFKQAEVGDKLKMKQSNYSDYETGVTEPSYHVINSFAVFFDISEEYFFKDIDPTKYLLLNDFRELSFRYITFEEVDRPHILKSIKALLIGLGNIEKEEFVAKMKPKTIA